MVAAMAVKLLQHGDADEDFAPYVSAVPYPVSSSGTASGLSMRPAAARSSASAALPCGLRFPSKSWSESALEDFPGPSVNA